MARKTSSTSDSTANLGFEARLWITTDKLRNSMDAAEYKHVLAPYKGRMLDLASGSAGMLVHSARFVREHRGCIGDLSIWGQESTATTSRLALMNRGIRGIEGDPRPGDADIFRCNFPPDLRAHLLIARPPSSNSDWCLTSSTTCAGSSASRPRATPTSSPCSTPSITSLRVGCNQIAIPA
jgi:type I restriction-modification system DNA methylase subunit